MIDDGYSGSGPGQSVGADIFGVSYNNDRECIRGPDDFTIEYIKIYPWKKGAATIDVTNTKTQMNIYEDIFSNFMMGNISILDAWDLPMLLPLIGEETIEISFKRPGTKEQTGAVGAEKEIPPYENMAFQKLEETKSFKMVFRIVAMTERERVRDQAQHYVLHFISPELLSNKKKKIGKAYKSMLYSEMVESIYNTHIKQTKEIEIEPTQFKQNFVASNWNPSMAINIIAGRSIPKGRQGASYLFFETASKFHYVSLEQLYSAEPKEVMLYQWNNVNVSPLNKAIWEEVHNIHGYDFAEYFDVLTNLQYGMYASKLMTYDLVRQRYFEYKFDYAKEFELEAHLDKNKICTDDLDALGEPYMARFHLMSTNKDHDKIAWINGKEPGILPMQLESYVLRRQSQLLQLQNVRLWTTLPGNPERQVGQTIMFAQPNAMGIPSKYGDEPEKYLSGKYLITAIRHRLEQDAYFQDVEIVKDSFLNKIEYIDPAPIYAEGAGFDLDTRIPPTEGPKAL